MIEFVLPYPPSVNRYWRHVGRRVLIGREGRAYREAVGAILKARRVRPMIGWLEAHIALYPPDRRRRDADNAMKALLDSMEHGGAYENDYQLERIEIERMAPVTGGQVIVRLWPREDEGRN